MNASKFFRNSKSIQFGLIEELPLLSLVQSTRTTQAVLNRGKVPEMLKNPQMKGKGRGVWNPKLGLPLLFLSWFFFFLAGLFGSILFSQVSFELFILIFFNAFHFTLSSNSS